MKKKRDWITRHQAVMSETLYNRLRKRSRRKGKAIRIIVRFKRQLSAARLRRIRKRLGGRNAPFLRQLSIINAIHCIASEVCLKRLCGMKGVGRIYLDRIRRSKLHIATPSIGSSAVQRRQGLAGQGINVAIIDTGVYPHPDLTRPVNRIVAFKDFVNNRTKPYDDNGHGTHMAGDVAGNGTMSGGKYKGPAPKAGIVAVKALNRSGDGYDSTIIRAIGWCIANRKRLKLRIVTLSLGGTAGVPCRDDPLCQAVEKAVRSGLTVFTAAGNAGPGRGTIESPGTSPSSITVGASDDRRSLTQAGDRVTAFSSRGPAAGGGRKPDLVAPGVAIVSLRAPLSKLDRQYSHQRVGKHYFWLSGTSVSAAIAAGAAAQLLQRRRKLSPRGVKTALKRNAFSLGEGGNVQGSGEIDVRFLNRR